MKLDKTFVLFSVVFFAIIFFIVRTNFSVDLTKSRNQSYKAFIESFEGNDEKDITFDEIRVEQEKILAQVALRNSMHNQMTNFYVQVRGFHGLFSYIAYAAYDTLRISIFILVSNPPAF